MSLTMLGKRAASALLALALAAGLGLAGTAAAWAAPTGWTVTFTGDKMESDGTADVLAQVKRLQPGDAVEFDIDLHNAYDGSADWYMKTAVLRTMEELADNGGGSYSYRLAYTNPAGEEKLIYTNDTVSGDSGKNDTNGLFDATDATQEWFFLDTLPADARARVVLAVSLDPESHGNSYFDTEAALELSFAAEPTAQPTAENKKPADETPAPKDETDAKNETPAKDEQPTGLLARLAQTGDAVMLAVGGLAVVAAVAVALLCVARRRSRVNEEGETR